MADLATLLLSSALIIFVYLARHKLSNLMDALTNLINRFEFEGRKGSINFRVQQKSSGEFAKDLGLEESRLPSDSPLTQERTKDIEKIMEEFKIFSLLPDKEKAIADDLASFSTNEKKLEVTTRFLAATQLIYHFELIDKQIYYSQIQILDHLNKNPAGVNIDVLRLYYDDAQKRYPLLYANYSFEGYLIYLTSRSLI